MDQVSVMPSEISTSTPRVERASVRTVWSDVGWAPVIAAAVAAISVQLLFTVLGMAVGISAVGAETRDTPAIPLAAGAWWLASGTLALLIGGAVYGRLSSLPRSNELLFHAFVMWGVTAIFGFAVLWSAAGMGSLSAARVWQEAPWSAPEFAPESQRSAASADPQLIARNSERDVATVPSLETTRRYARNVAWWSVLGLLLGIGAALGGAWWAATDVIVKEPSINT